jgi:hypothetical protein
MQEPHKEEKERTRRKTRVRNDLKSRGRNFQHLGNLLIQQCSTSGQRLPFMENKNEHARVLSNENAYVQQPFTEAEVLCAISSDKNSDAAGPYQIYNDHLKATGEDLVWAHGFHSPKMSGKRKCSCYLALPNSESARVKGNKMTQIRTGT